jgi:hypothetical protein
MINPIIGSLDLEAALVAKRNWTWRFQPASLERSGPVRRYLDRRAWANLEQLLDLYPAAGQAVQAHDSAAGQLLERAGALHRALVASGQFIQLCDSIFAPDSLSRLGIMDVQEVIGAYPTGARYALMAEYVVNSHGILPEYYATARLWNAHWSAFLESLTWPGIREPYATLLEGGTALASATERLARALKDLRLELSLAHDVPYVSNNEAA